MTINHIYNKIESAMKELENINILDIRKKAYNQTQVNKAYNILDSLKEEIIREDIKKKRGGTNE